MSRLPNSLIGSLLYLVLDIGAAQELKHTFVCSPQVPLNVVQDAVVTNCPPTLTVHLWMRRARGVAWHNGGWLLESEAVS
jgi:hypothetical protein